MILTVNITVNNPSTGYYASCQLHENILKTNKNSILSYGDNESADN